jgi:catechol 2,3-dioxygenase-like lactoylglutathione lyase family enzyme
MAVRRLNHAVLYINGLAREVEFYTKTLGFEVRTEVPGRAAFLRSSGSVNDHDLGLFEIGTGQADGRPKVGLYHLAWEVGTLADLAETRQKLLDAGALVGESDHRLSKSLYAKDPSGIEFEVLWRVPPRGLGRGASTGRSVHSPLGLGPHPVPLGPEPENGRGGELPHVADWLDVPPLPPRRHRWHIQPGRRPSPCA